jgi:hypothetical protein
LLLVVIIMGRMDNQVGKEIVPVISTTPPDAALILFAPDIHDRDGWILAMSWMMSAMSLGGLFF